jgi:hypothetical protein
MTPITLTYAIARSHDREHAARVNRPRPVTPAWWRRRGA